MKYPFNNKHTFPSIVFGIGWLWGATTFVLAGAFHTDSPNGYAWNRYMLSAWGLENGNYTLYNPFREPLYSLLLAFWGEKIGYMEAGIWISSLSMLVVLFCTGWMVKRLANDWAAAITMILLPCSASTLSSTQWINYYPIQSAAFAVIIALCLELTRRRSFVFLVIASTLMGFCFAVDVRMWLLGPFLLLTLFLRSRTISVLSIAIGIFLCWAPTPIMTSVANIPEHRTLSFEDKRTEQQRVVRRWQGFLHDPHVDKYCLPLPQEDLVQPSTLLHPCARATLWHNIRHIHPQHISTASWSGLALLVFFLPPYRRRDRLRLCTLISIGIPIAVWASWTHFPDRYMIIPLSVWHALVPIALYRLWKRYAARFLAFPILGGVFLLSQLDDTERLRQQRTSLQRNERMQAAQSFVQSINQAPAPVRDCTDIRLEAAFLPTPPRKEKCTEWIKSTSGPRWVVLSRSQRHELSTAWTIHSEHAQYILAHHQD